MECIVVDDGSQRPALDVLVRAKEQNQLPDMPIVLMVGDCCTHFPSFVSLESPVYCAVLCRACKGDRTASIMVLIRLLV
jgi:hypothetical protein